MSTKNSRSGKSLKPLVNARYEGHQDVVGSPGFDLLTLDEDISGHPGGSTLSEQTLRDAGWAIPNRRNKYAEPPQK